MRIGVVYFSGTGNTAFICNTIEKTFKEKGNEVFTFPIEKGLMNNVDYYDFLIFAAPKYYEYIAPYFMEYIKNNMKKSKKGINAAIILNAGAGLKTGFNELIEILNEKNVKTVATKTLKMPSNYTLPPYKGIANEKCVNYSKKAEIEAGEFALSINDKNYSMEYCSKFKESICKNLSHSFGKNLHKKASSFNTTKKCKLCGTCVKNCPVKNISIDNGQIKFHDNCILCTRCLSICPNNAITYKDKKVTQYRFHINEILGFQKTSI